MTSHARAIVRLQHMLDNIDGVTAITAGLSIELILADYMLIRATERGLQIISEAARALPPDVLELEPAVPWKDIIGIGNLLRHEYDRLDPMVLDSILKTELSTLRAAVPRLKRQLEG